MQARAHVGGRATRGRAARLARRRLQVARGLAHRPADYGQGDAERGAVRGHQRLVILGFSPAERVIDVEGMEPLRPRVAQGPRGQHVQQGDRVLSTRHHDQGDRTGAGRGRRADNRRARTESSPPGATARGLDSGEILRGIRTPSARAYRPPGAPSSTAHVAIIGEHGLPTPLATTRCLCLYCVAVKPQEEEEHGYP